MRYGDIRIDNDFTFLRGNTKSQIDFALTNVKGRSNIQHFKIAQSDWHISDHRMIELEIKVETEVCATFLLTRSRDLNRTNCDETKGVTQFRGNYDYFAIKNNLERSKEDIISSVQLHLDRRDVEAAVCSLETAVKKAHIGTRIKPKISTSYSVDAMSRVNSAFDDYLVISRNSRSNIEIQAALDHYMEARKKITTDTFKGELKIWNDALKSNDAKSLWRCIDWKGNYRGEKQYDAPDVKEFEHFYEDLYDNNDPNELQEIEKLDTDIIIPELDNPISNIEMLDAFNEMKKPGFDFNLPVLGILLSHFSILLLNIFNAMFFIQYPLTLAISLLSLIPKKGNLLLPKNFRGIQMMKLLACLYDRIITNRLKPWLKFHIDQTAFQALKSTLIHIFTVRLLIVLVKKKNKPLFIASMDIEKAFDSVSRYLLLQKLIKLGISKSMLSCLKAIYSCTMCVIKFKGVFSEIFRMLRGIRQGAPSSVLLFNVFIDGLFEYLEEKCEHDALLHDIHTLIHADDTIVIGTNRPDFVEKCNHTKRFFDMNKLKLNKTKLWFTVVNSRKREDKENIKIEGAVIKYRNYLEYLGVIISDSGSIDTDIKSYLDSKRSNVSVKFLNYCSKNRNAPLSVKLDVLDRCVTSSLIYASETWGRSSEIAETIYRAGLRIALDVRESINNEILYIESGRYPLQCIIKKSQVRFWINMMEYKDENSNSALAKTLEMTMEENLHIVSYYTDLLRDYNTPETCQRELNFEFKEKWTNRIRESAHQDMNSRLGTYYQINPDLTPWIPYPQTIMESERKLVTRFRTGSHSLNIEIMRYSNVLREDRLCVCKDGIQTVWHVFMQCPLTQGINRRNYDSLKDIFDDDNIQENIMKIATRLKVPLGRT